MRADMAKVLVERPRPGSRMGSMPGKGYRKRMNRAMAHPDGVPSHEGMTDRYNWTRGFNENLAPLKRYVASQVGRPWDTVHSEICERINLGNVVQKHILTHLYDYVVTDVMMIDGRPCWGKPTWGNRTVGVPIEASRFRFQFYVCPKSGILKRVPTPRPQPKCRGPKPPPFVRVNDASQCRFINGQWELISLAPLPVLASLPPPRDVILNKPATQVSAEEAINTYGAKVFAVTRRVLRKKERKNYPIPIEFLR